jgi:hypothetical protein
MYSTAWVTLSPTLCATSAACARGQQEGSKSSGVSAALREQG